MQHEMTTATRTKWAIAAIVALAALGIAAPLAFADNIGAPTSAAGGVSTPSSPTRPPAVGPQDSTTTSTTGGSTSSGTQSRTPGTGKFEDPKSPCIGTTGFGSSSAQPGQKC